MEIIWRPSAVEDIEQARRYIAQFNPGAATRVFAAIRTSVRTLADFPQRGRLGRVEGTRELVVPRTPYLIAYTVIGQQLVILAVLHHAREWPETLCHVQRRRTSAFPRFDDGLTGNATRKGRPPKRTPP